MHYCLDGCRLFCMNHWQPSPASFFLEAGKLISYETRTYVCVHMLCHVTAAAIRTCASLAKNHKETKKPQTNRPHSGLKKKKRRHQCYIVSLKSEYKDIRVAPVSVAVTSLPAPGAYSFLFLL